MKKELIHRIGSFLLAAAVAASLAAPAGAADVPMLEQTTTTEDRSGNPDPGIELTDFELAVPDKLVLTHGTNGELNATVKAVPDGATLEDSKIQWEWISTQPTTVLVDDAHSKGSSALLIPQQLGITQVTAVAKLEISGKTVEKRAVCEVTVQPTAATNVVIVPSNVTLDPQKSQILTASVEPSTADPTNVTWEVDEQGKDVVQLSATSGSSVTVTGLKPGKATITASSGGSAKGVCEVDVRGVLLSESTMTIPVGTSKTLGATPHGGIGTLVEWSSGNDSVAFVSANGEITAQSVGKTRITATVGGYSASCEITVSENTANTVTGSVDAGQSFKLSKVASELNGCSQSVLGESLNYVTNLMVPTDEGILYYGYVSPDDTGYGIGNAERYYYSSAPTGARSLSDVTFVPAPDHQGPVSIHYTGFGSGNKSFTGTIKLDVKGTADVTYTTSPKTPVQFQANDFSRVCRARTGRDLSYVTFELPSMDRGTLYYNYSGQDQYAEKVDGTTKYGRSASPYLDNVSFVPHPDYTGTLYIRYRCVDVGGGSFSGQITLIVSGKDGTGSGEINYTVRSGGEISFRSDDFNQLSRKLNRATLSYVRFELPDSSKGTLYYNYRSGSSSEKVSDYTRYYYNNSPYISNITFVPNSGYAGTVDIKFVGYDVDGGRFDGRVSIRTADGGHKGTVRYSVRAGRSVTFSAADFNEACQDINRESLDYVRFELPPSSKGTLYYNYRSGNYNDKVSESGKYYRSGSPSVSDVTFVPDRGYRGLVTIYFTGYDTAGRSFGGIVEVDVDGSTVNPEIKYSVSNGGVVTFNSADFDRVSQDLTDRTLNYVRFELPNSNRGELYYDYNTSNGTYNSKVNSSRNYSRSGGSWSLDRVAFVADQTYTGLVTIPYTGWNTRGEKFTGTVDIQVSRPTANTIRYMGSSNPIRLQVSDLRLACNSLLGRELSYIQFDSLPTQQQGRLYLSYVSPSQTGTPAATGTSYYYNRAPGMDQLSFVARAGFQGKVTIPYTGVDGSGSRFSGTIEITIDSGLTPSRFSDMDRYGWAKPSVEFLFQNGIAGGVTNTQYGPSQKIRRGDFVLMLCKALQLRTGSTTSFSDVPTDSYYAWAVATAKDLGIASGNNGRFMPNEMLTRQDAMVMIKQALIAAGRSVPAGNPSVLNSYADGDKVAGYAREAVAALIQMGVVSGDNAKRLNPNAGVLRAEMAVMLHSVLTL